jgi:hypothetical protein
MNTLLVVATVVEALAAIAFIAAPAAALAPFGVTLEPASISIARLFGSAVLAFPVLLWHARASADAGLKRVAVRTLIVYWLASAAIIAITLLGGLMDALGWSLVTTHVVLAIWSAALLRK